MANFAVTLATEPEWLVITMGANTFVRQAPEPELPGVAIGSAATASVNQLSTPPKTIGVLYPPSR